MRTPRRDSVRTPMRHTRIGRLWPGIRMMIRGEAGAAVNREQFGNIHAVRAEEGEGAYLGNIYNYIHTEGGRERHSLCLPLCLLLRPAVPRVMLAGACLSCVSRLHGNHRRRRRRCLPRRRNGPHRSRSAYGAACGGSSVACEEETRA